MLDSFKRLKPAELLIIMFEADSAKECFKWFINWGDLGKYESFPVVEVEDDKGTKVSE